MKNGKNGLLSQQHYDYYDVMYVISFIVQM